MKRLTVVSILVGIIIMLTLTGCGQVITKEFGGDMTVNLPKDQKLIEATWKDTDLWYLTKKATSSDKSETYLFIEDSTFGIAEGSVTFIEHVNEEDDK